MCTDQQLRAGGNELVQWDAFSWQLALENAFHAPHVELELAKLLVITCPGKLDSWTELFFNFVILFFFQNFKKN